MKPINWTKADEKRAEKMGWFLWLAGGDGVICTGSNHFKSDAEAARWVVDGARFNYMLADIKTCRKAVLICCGGAR